MAQSRELKNLLRRVRRFNQANPQLALNVEAIKSNSPSKISAASNRLAKVQKVARIQKQIAKVARTIPETVNAGHVAESAIINKVKPVKFRKPKTLSAAQRELQRLQGLHAKAADFRKAQDNFARKVKKYNQSLGLRNNKNRYLYLPRNAKELAQHEQALKLVRRGKLDEAKKVLGIKVNQEIRRALLKRDSRRATSTGTYTYRDRIFLWQAIENAKSSHVPELAQLFREGGESLVLELENAGFTMIEYYDPDESMDDVGMFILAQLESTIPELNARNQVIVRNFLDRTQDKYA